MMPDEPLADEEPEDSAGEPKPEVGMSKGLRQSFTGVRRQLSDEELGSPAVQKILLDDLERLEQEAQENKGILSKFHDADKKVGVLQEKMKTHNAFELISGGTLVLGGLLMGIVPGIWDDQPKATILLIIAALLLAIGLIAKVVKL